MIAHIQAPAAIGGRITAPPSKSMAHRAVLSAALARGCSRVENLEFSQDVDATLTAAARLGAQVERGEGWARITGHGLSLIHIFRCGGKRRGSIRCAAL